MAQCIDALEGSGPAALEEVLASQPAEAERARRRLAALSKVGLLSLPDGDWAESIGPYRVLRRLGGGGMGEVVLAEHGETGARVAIKLGPIPQVSLSPEHDQDTERANERFSREVRSVAGLCHPSIVPILDVGEHKGRPWFATEYVDGAPLDRVLETIRSGDTPPSDLSGRDLAAAVPGAEENAFGTTWVAAIAGIIKDIAGALVEAHGAGIVHRDIKPSNILLRPDGRVQVVDFGLAHVADMPTLTLSGEFAGTPYYVAPEQVGNVRGGVDGRADVFSLGVTLYECASLQRPFTGQTPLEVLSSICGREPEPLRRVAPHLPVDLERLCRRALEKDAAHRYPTMQAFADDLGRLLEFRPLMTAPLTPLQRSARWARRRPWRAAFVGLAGLFLLAAPIALLVVNSKIRSERDLVMEEAQRNRLVVEHFVEHFDATPDDPMTDEAALALLHRGAQRLQYGLTKDPRVRASLLHASARAYLQLGRPGDARPLLDRAFGLWLREGESARDDRARVLGDLARVHIAEGRPDFARDVASRALEELSSDGTDLEFRQRMGTTIASAHVALGDVDLARAELASLGDAVDTVRDDVAAVWEAVGRRELEGGAHGRAEGAFTAALELLQRGWSPSGQRLADVHDGLADAAERLEGPAAPSALGHRARAVQLRSVPSAGLDANPEDSGPFPFLGEPRWAKPYEAAFDQGIAALQAGRIDDARRRFVEAHACRPSPAVAAFNLACVESLANEQEESVRWLERARRWGFACTEVRVQGLMRDADLQACRETPKGQEVVQSLREQWEAARAFASRTVTVPAPRPKGAAGDWRPPLLLVVHDYGESPSKVASGMWSDVAASLGATLLVPCAPYLVGETVEEGAAWAPDPRDLWSHPESHCLPILDQVRTLLDQGDVDRSRIWIGGSGLGALLAMDLLAQNPGLFQGGWLVDPVLHERSGGASGHLARVLGARLAVSITGDAPPAEAHAPDVDTYAADVERWLSAAGDWGASVRVDREAPTASNDLRRWLAR